EPERYPPDELPGLAQCLKLPGYPLNRVYPILVGTLGQERQESRLPRHPVAGREARGEERKRLVSEKVERLVQAGASIARTNDTVRGNSIAMRDLEGNEFCVS